MSMCYFVAKWYSVSLQIESFYVESFPSDISSEDIIPITEKDSGPENLEGNLASVYFNQSVNQLLRVNANVNKCV